MFEYQFSANGARFRSALSRVPIIAVFAAATLSLPHSARAQNADSPFQLQKLVYAKLDKGDDEDRMIFKLKTQMEIRTRKVQVTRMVNQERVVKRVINGKEIEEKVTVAAPVTEEVQQTYTVNVPTGTDFVPLSASKIAFFHMDGTKATQAEVIKNYAKLKPIFFWQRNPSDVKLQSADKIILDAMDPDTLVAVSDALVNRALEN
ncbi:MAG: hypothetical protein AAF483_20800 [Planctomycetota bacterium]